MAIGILIQRITRNGEDAKVLLPHIIELRALGVKQPGYISGETMLKAFGLVEFRAHRNILGTPQVRSTSVSKTLSDWATYTDSDEWRTLEAEVRAFATNIRVEIRGPSPVLPEPVRPG